MRSAIATGLLLAAAALSAGCGGDGDDAEVPSTGVPLAHGRCTTDAGAQKGREARVESGEISAKEARIAEITEVRTCEVERNTIKLKKEICAHDAGDLLDEEKVT
jgi:hypothetical protein